MLLEQIQDHSDMGKLNDEQARLLCRELRTFLLEQVSRTGGHLASNLGVVELTVAIHRVFDTSQDRLVFDVGHQCYVHKALTGRRELFVTLRQLDGLSGFPKPWESPHDAFIAGHASNSVSVALGMARARTLLHQHYQVLALIGDGALGGGLSFEGLNDAGASHEPMIVILNDNGMSIDPNVGGMSRHLSRLRSKPGYYAFKKRYRQVLESSQTGQRLYSVSHDVKTALKKSLLPGSTLFENMGFTYMGPVDGHDVVQLTRMLREAKDLHCPVLLHVHTVKGQGYGPAEADPGRFHGIGPFDVRTGSGKPAAPSFSSVFGETLTRLAGEDRRICALTAAMVDGTGLTKFSKTYMKKILGLGFTPFFMSSTEGILQVAFNRQLLLYGGDLSVSAMTILLSMSQILSLPMEGIAQGAQPIISYNFGAKKYDRVKETIKITIKVALTYSIIGVLLMEAFPQVFVSLFANNTQLIQLSYQLLRIYIFGFIIMGAFSTFQQTYNALGCGKNAFFFAFFRKIILLIPLIYLLPFILPSYGVYAVVLAEPISDLMTTILNGIYFKHFVKKTLA